MSSVAAKATGQVARTVANAAVATKVTDGPTVVTKQTNGSNAARLMFVVNGGPVYETTFTRGISQFARRMAFRDNLISSDWRLDALFTVSGITAPNCGATLINRKFLSYGLTGGSETLNSSIVVDKLLQCILFPRFHSSDVDYLRPVILSEQQQMKFNDPIGYAKEMLTETAFKGQPLGNSIFVPPYNAPVLSTPQLWDWWEQHVSPHDILVVGENMDHDQLVDNVADNEFLQMAHIGNPKSITDPVSEYVGGVSHVPEFKRYVKDIQFMDIDEISGVAFKAPGINDTKGRVAAAMIASGINRFFSGGVQNRSTIQQQAFYDAYDTVGLLSVIMRNASELCFGKLKGCVEGFTKVTPAQLETLKKAATIDILSGARDRTIAPELITTDFLEAPQTAYIVSGDDALLTLINQVTAADLAKVAQTMLGAPATIHTNYIDNAVPLKF